MTLALTAPTDESPDHRDRETRLIVENMPGFAWSAGQDGKLRYVTPRFLEFTGRRIEEVARPDVLHPEDVAATLDVWSHAVATGDPYVVEHRVRRFDGTYRWFRVSAVRARDPNSREMRWYGLDLDIDDQKRTDEALRHSEDALRKSEQELRGIVDALPETIVVIGPDGVGQYVNRPLLDYTGLTREQLMSPDARGNPLLFDPDDLARLKEERLQGLAREMPFEIECRVRRKDGQYRWFLVRYNPLRDEQGRILRWYASGTDIDDRKRAEEALRKSEQELRLLIETLPAMVWRTTADGVADYMNQRFLNYFGRPLAALQQKWLEVMHPDDVATAVRECSRALQTETPIDATCRYRRADGVYHWFHVRAEPFRDADGHVVHWYGVHVDIDDLKKAEEALRATQAQLARASALATVSGVAASIAHEISQPLAAMVANGNACQRWLAGDPPNLERAQLAAERIVRDGTSAAEVVRRIRALFKRTDLTRTLVNLNHVIGEVSRMMMDESTARNVSIETDLADDLPPIWADPVQMQQVIANLVRNGVDAMASQEHHPRVLGIRSRRDGTNRALIEIRDHGSGLEDVEKVFEPFFTTKQEGMGMGLAICRWIVEAHEGRLWAGHNSPRGAVFSFTMPISPRAA